MELLVTKMIGVCVHCVQLAIITILGTKERVEVVEVGEMLLLAILRRYLVNFSLYLKWLQILRL